VNEIYRLTGEGVDVVFDSIGGTHIWRSRKALRPGGTVVAYGLTGSLRGGRLASSRSGGRHRFRAIAIFGLYIAGGWLLPGRKLVVPYSIQWLKRLKPELFRQDLIALFKPPPTAADQATHRSALPPFRGKTRARVAWTGGVTGKIVLMPNGPSRKSGAA